MTKVLTWNVDGQTSGGVGILEAIEDVIVDADPDVACLQEFGAPPQEAELRDNWQDGGVELYEFPNEHPLQAYYLLHYSWDGGSNRVNPAILWLRGHTPDPEGAVAYPDPDDKWWRNAIGFGLPQQGALSFFTIHAISGRKQAPDARYLLEQIHDLVGTPWVAAGDFNTEPGDLRQRLRDHGHGWGVRPPDGVTRDRDRGRPIDYLVHTGADDQPGNVQPMPEVDGHAVSDHFPVLFENV